MMVETNGSNGDVEISFTISRYSAVPRIDRLAALLYWAASEERLRGEVGVWLCTDDEIAKLHLQFMDIDGPTDVITFPAEDEGTGGYLGDVAVSVDTAHEQAADAGHSPEREIAFLCLHGLLHLAGYDDLTPVERSAMIARQELMLETFERSNPGEWAREPRRDAGNDSPQRS
jgi:probable rRNA maturation factor